MRAALIFFIFILFAGKATAQQDYFYAENLFDHGQYAEAVRVLDHLIDSGAYNDRPRFQLMTLNMAATTKLYLKDTTGAKKNLAAAMSYFDTLSGPRKSDDWNHREYYIAGEHLARVHYAQHDYKAAHDLLKQIKCPGEYYSATGIDVLIAEDNYYSFCAQLFQKENQPDSAFACIRKMRDREYFSVRKLDSIFDVRTNYIHHVKCVPYTLANIDLPYKKPGYLYFVAWTDETNTQRSTWFVNPERGTIEIIGQSTFNMEDDRDFPANCYDMSLSPDEKYLAVECYTEGSNTVQVISFPEILTQKKCIMKHELLAYPASITIKGWERSQLWLECEADLTKLNKKSRLSYMDYPADDAKKSEFLFDPENGKYSRK